MKRLLTLLCLSCGVALLQGCRLGAQELPDRLKTSHAPLNERLAALVTADSLAISPAESLRLPDPLYLDAREAEEYAVSHLPAARHLGYREPDYTVVADVARDRPVVVYCTVGYRSERAARKLRERGFTRVYNLYGSIYAWKLAGLPVEDAAGPTNRLHVYSKKWGTFVPPHIGEKVY